MRKIVAPSNENILLAAQILRNGGLVAIPTETVYGLAADASNPEAVRKIFTCKKRPADHPLIVHLHDIKQLSDWSIDIPASAYQLAKKFWPGPLTMVLKKHPNVSEIVTGEQDTIGLRIPNHPVTLALLKAFDGAVAAPSANLHCHISPTTAEHVLEELGDSVDLILDGGPCQVGIESTIINLCSKQPEILRPGMVSLEEIHTVLSQDINVRKTSSSPKVAGDMEKHYAPHRPAYLMDHAEIVIKILQLPTAAVLSIHEKPKGFEGIWLQLSNQPIQYAQQLYAMLRQADQECPECIFVEKPPQTPEWDAIYNRLIKACNN